MSRILILSFLLCLISMVIVNAQTGCQNNCNGHGTCVDMSRCVCNRYYYGEDCSIWRDSLVSGVQKTGVVARFEWKYYNFTLNAGEAFVLNVAQTQAENDIDLYYQADRLPSFTDYLGDDVGTDPTFSVSLAQPVTSRTTIYVGIFGFRGTTDYTLNLQVTGGCPNGCSGHGRCTRGACVCDAGYSGESCELSSQSIVLNQDYNNLAVAEDGWLLYTYNLQSQANLNLHITQSSGDVDIYLKYGAPPTQVDYDIADTSTNEDISVPLVSPQIGTWYIGFYGYQESTFSFRLTRETGCPGRCSNHGTCTSGVCSCNAGYSGSSCETKRNNLLNGEIVAGYVSENNWNYYTYATDSANNFVIEVNQTTSGADCDIYVQRNQNPTLSDYLFADVSTENVAHLRVDDAGTATWYIGIFGYESCGYNMKVYESSSCPGGCGAHGDCNANGRCVCRDGYVGANCETRSGDITNGGVLTGQVVASGEWKYYSVTVSSTSQLNIIVKEKNTYGQVWLFVSAGQYPTLASHEADDTESNTNIHRISLEFATPRTGTQYFIGVYGSPLALRDVEFDVSVFYPPFKK